jgi:hypothetical protein
MLTLFQKKKTEEDENARRVGESQNEVLTDEVRTDIFEISSDSNLLFNVSLDPSEKMIDPFKEMGEVIHLLLYSKEKRSIKNFEENLRIVDVEINGETLWSIKAAKHSEKNEGQLQREFEVAKQAFISFPGNDILAKLKMKKIVELKQSVLHAAFPFLSRNYRLSNKSYNYHLETKQIKTKMTRNTLENKDIFAIIFTGPCGWLIDGVRVVNNTYSNVNEGVNVQDIFLTLNENGHLKRYPEPINDASRTEIFHLTVIGELDLSLFTIDNQIVTARFRVEVSSTCKQFRYFGPRQSTILKQLQNLPNIERTGYYDFSRAPILGKKINQFLTDRATELQRAIETIISQKEKIEARKGDAGTIFAIRKIQTAQATLLSAVSNLFSAAMNKKIMRNIVDLFVDEILKEHKIHLLIDEQDNNDQSEIDLSKKFQEKFKKYLNKKRDFESLVKQTIEELTAVCDELTDGKLLELYLMMKINFVNELMAGAFYFERYNERFMLDGKELEDTLQPLVARYSSGVNQSIIAIVEALIENLKRRGYKVIYPGTRIALNVSKNEEETIKLTKTFEEDFIRYIKKKQSKNNFGLEYQNVEPFYYELVRFDCDLKEALSSSECQSAGSISEEVFVKAGKKVNTLQEFSITVPSLREELQERLLESIPVRERGEFRNIFNNSSTIAVLLERGVLKGFNEGLSLHYLLDLVLSGWPMDRLTAQPYLIALDVSGGIIGTLIGRHAILYPNKPLNKWIVAWETCTRGISLTVLTMYGSIVIYRNYFNNSTNCPSRTECGMEPTQFSTDIVLPSALFGVANTVFRLLYDLQYLSYGEVKSLRYRVPNWLYTSICNSLLIQTFLLKDVFDNGAPEETTMFIPSAIIGFSLATLLEVLPWRKVWEFIPVLMALLSVATYMGIWYQESEGQRQQDIDPLTPIEDTRIAFWSLLSVCQFLFIFRNSTQFIGNYVGDFIQIMKMEPKEKLLQNLPNHPIPQGYRALDEGSTNSVRLSEQKSDDEIEANTSLDLSAMQRFDSTETHADSIDKEDKESIFSRTLILSGTLSRSTSSTLTRENSESNFRVDRRTPKPKGF